VDSLYQGVRGRLGDDVAITTPFAIPAPVITAADPGCGSDDGTPVALSGEQQLADGRRVELSAPGLAAPLEGALSALSIAMVLLAAGLVAARS
jgi:hypothetical protein